MDSPRRLTGSVLLSLALFVRGAAAAELHVPAQYPTIQAAIDAASSGDVVLVAPGTYVERINFLGKRLLLEAPGGAAVTTILAGTPGSVVTAVAAEPFGTALRGFTLTGATQGTLVGSDPVGFALAGGGVLVDGGAHLALTDCVISGNTAEGPIYGSKGGGVAVVHGTVFLEGCAISGNTASRGAAISNLEPMGQATVIARDCTITANTSTTLTLSQREAVLFNSCSFDLTDCLIADNIGNGMTVIKIGYVFLQRVTFSGNTGWGYTNFNSEEARLYDCLFLGNGLGGASLETAPSFSSWNVAENCIFAQGDRLECKHAGEQHIYNCSFDGAGVDAVGGIVDVRDSIFRNVAVPVTATGPVSITYSDVEGGYPGVGNIDVDPLWVNPAAGDYSFAATSPCLDAGDPGSPLDPNGTVSDMGAVPFGLWDDLGGGVPWTWTIFGVPYSDLIPRLIGQGVLAPGEPVGLALARMPALTPVVLVLGTTALPVPFKGGTLWPTLQVVLGGLVTDASGALGASSTWPVGVPPGFVLYAQVWLPDASAPFGFTGSNGVVGTAP